LREALELRNQCYQDESPNGRVKSHHLQALVSLSWTDDSFLKIAAEQGVTGVFADAAGG
jgi:hypothetical protein